MKKIKGFHFGSIDYTGNGRKDCQIVITVELRDTEKGPEFSASGIVTRGRGTVAAGQILDSAKEAFHRCGRPVPEDFEKIYCFWQKYHLNGMHPECEHQRAAGWTDQAKEVLTPYHYKLTREAANDKREAEMAAVDALKRGETFTPTAEQTAAAVRKTFLDTYDNLTAEQAAYYEPDIRGLHGEMEKKTRGWVKFEDDKRGILCKPCPVCGYKYGSAWRYMPIAENDLIEIERLLNGGSVLKD